jgi:GT2 family glycosyltransferase
MKLLVVVVCYKITDLTLQCLESLDGKIQQVPDAHVAVVENGTGGDSADRLRAAIEANGWGGWCSLTAIHPNLGFTGGNNVAIRAHLESADPPEYVLLLNADTIVLENAFPPLVDFMDRHPRAGVAGSHFIGPGGEFRSSHARFQGIFSELDRGLKLGLITRLLRPWIASGPYDAAHRVDWVPGASMILRRSMLDEIGLLDEGLYTYFDDLDICMRARRAGWETWYVPESRIIHIEGASTGVQHVVRRRLPPYWFEARRRYFLKSHGPLKTALSDAAFIAGHALFRARRPLQGKPDTDPPHLLIDSIRHSVFATGFRVREVENPALRDHPTPRVAEGVAR